MARGQPMSCSAVFCLIGVYLYLQFFLKKRIFDLAFIIDMVMQFFIMYKEAASQNDGSLSVRLDEFLDGSKKLDGDPRWRCTWRSVLVLNRWSHLT